MASADKVVLAGGLAGSSGPRRWRRRRGV